MTFEIHGYFETLHDVRRNKTLGVRNVELEPGRALGEAGARTVTLTTDTELSRGIKTKTFRASVKRPIECISVVRPICGRMIDR